jgi:hypothetical protein
VVVISQTSTSLWRTGQCLVPRLARQRTRRSREMKKASQLKFTELSGEPKAPVANGHLRDQQATRGQANGRLVTPDSVRCANGPRGPTIGCARYGRKSSTGQVLFMSGGAPDCPMHHSTEGKICLPS